MKALVIGASLSGKTAVVRYLRSKTDIPVSEMDEELTKLNKGKYPTDNEYKHKVLAPRIIQKVLNSSNVVFFTNTDYFNLDDLHKAKNSGFKIIQFELDISGLKKRNKNRVRTEGYDDLSKWLEGMVQYQKQIKEAGIVDATIQADKSVEKIAEETLKILTTQD